MDTAKLLNWMCSEFRDVLTRPREQGGVGWVKNDCIRTAKMAIALLKRFDVPAREISVRTLIANKTLTTYMKQAGKELLYMEPEEVRAISGAFIAMMGRRENAPPIKGMWRGHLPVIVNENYLLDLTIDSANDHKQGFALQPLAAKINSVQDIDAGKPFVIMTSDHYLLYQLDKENSSYRESTAWTVWSELHQGITDACEQRVREILE